MIAAVEALERAKSDIARRRSHPMTPDLGQGACQALEDAAVLTRCLEQANDPVSALRKYESRRLRRANSFVLASRLVGRLFSWKVISPAERGIGSSNLPSIDVFN
jgi:2-polyprenyl-6-methoxyphenol hydroxylase-like FAD-dependent oxidoreductase